MAYKTPLIEFLPEFMRQYLEIQEIMGTEQEEFDSLWTAHDQVLLDNFVLDCDEYGISRWEKVTKITPKANSSLQERKYAVLSRINEQLPYSYRRLLEMIGGICGDNEYQVTLTPEKYLLVVKLRANAHTDDSDAMGLLTAVDALVKRIKPCNVVYASSLFDRHSGSIHTYFGCAVSMNKKYNVEVIS